MAALIRGTSRRLASQLQQLKGMTTFAGGARPGEPTPAINDASRGPNGPIEVRGRNGPRGEAGGPLLGHCRSM